ncbi:MAG: AAA family ATPase [Gemmataceae bacterium]|nr:AAA family ATPase [Gemmataceae bacterium]
MYTVTFYSFKGGVGRTMALVNVGLELARRGRRVLLVDFDLEAPGLTTYQALQRHPDHPGVVEYVTEYIRTKESPEISRFIYPVDLARVENRRKRHTRRNRSQKVNQRKSNGQLWVMPAGRGDAAYGEALSAINWNSLYEHLNGYLFFEDTKLQWQEAIKPDYVLIDSRTGHTDVGGICTRQLADAVVLLFTPNDQNLAGLKTVCSDIRREETEGLTKTIQLHFVASNVPNLEDEYGLLRRQLHRFAFELKGSFPPPITIHRMETLWLLDQPITVLQRPHSRLAQEYRRLVRLLIMDNPEDREGALLCLQSPRSLHARARLQPARHQFRLTQIETHFWDDPEILLHLAQWYWDHGALELALKRFDRVLELQPSSPRCRSRHSQFTHLRDALFARGRCRRQTGDSDGAAEDFLEYLRTSRKPDFFGALEEEADGKRQLTFDSEFALQEVQKNEHGAIRELVDINFDKFLLALACHEALKNSAFFIWLDVPAEYLIRQRRWTEAIWYLESKIPELTEKFPLENIYLTGRGEESFPGFQKQFITRFQGERAFYLAMAYWGQTGSLHPDLCRVAVLNLPLDRAWNLQSIGPPRDLQRLALLHWGLRDTDKAFALLDGAVDNHWSIGLFQGVSWWTFRESSFHEFRRDCDEMRRMFRGEPLQPAFLGPLRAPVQMERKSAAISAEDINGSLANGTLTVPQILGYLSGVICRVNNFADNRRRSSSNVRIDRSDNGIGIEESTIFELFKSATAFRNAVASSLPRVGLSRDDTDDRSYRDLNVFVTDHAENDTPNDIALAAVINQALRLVPELVKWMTEPWERRRGLDGNTIFELWLAAKALREVVDMLHGALYPARISM